MVIKLSVTLSICSMNTNIYRHILLRERYKKKDLGNIDKWINRWSEFGWIPLNAPYIPYDTERKTVDWKALWGSTPAHAVVLWQDSTVTQQSVCCSEISSPTSLRSRFRPRRTTPHQLRGRNGGRQNPLLAQGRFHLLHRRTALLNLFRLQEPQQRPLKMPKFKISPLNAQKQVQGPVTRGGVVIWALSAGTRRNATLF